MQLDTTFSISELETINKQAMIYMCSCPAQVSTQILSLRKLFDYQHNCSDSPNADDLQRAVHSRIAEATRQAHQAMERCLDDILELEGWDRATLTMPDGLRALLEKAIDEF